MEFKNYATKISRFRQINAATLTLLASIYFVAIFNFSFWAHLIKATGGISHSNFFLHAAIFIMLVAAFNGLLNWLAVRPILKPAFALLLIANSAIAYFVDWYGILIDTSVMQSFFETDIHEALEFLTWRLILTVLLFGVLPSVAVWSTRLPTPSMPLKQHLLQKIKITLFSLVIAAVLFAIVYKPLAPVFRENRELRFLITPVNYIRASYSYIKGEILRSLPATPFGTDANRGAMWTPYRKKSVTVIAVGETARAKNHSLNGYQRETNPQLSKQTGLINFSNVQSCDTSTSVSVPCVFSGLGREGYNQTLGNRENLLDILTRVGFNVIWRDNDKGCKGVCNRIPYEDFSRPVAGYPLCNSEGCYDQHLLKDLPDLIRLSEKDIVIVLHLRGSHGPYWKHYPEEFEKFTPACRNNDMRACTIESIVNAYDNTILYNDHVLARTIEMLREIAIKDNIDASMIYFSDHGESLGENGMFLHGYSYNVSPIEQRHIPMMMWFSNDFPSHFGIDMQCVSKRSAEPFSHDNVFHSILGMLNINTKVYNSSLDMFKPCKTRN